MSEMTKMREALLYVGSAHESVKRDALAEVEQWESELEVMAGALESKDADLAAAREALLVISGWDASAAKRHAAMGMREYAASALARLSAGKETT